MKLAIANNEIARVFDEIADVLEIKGDNPFRIRSYRNAARVIEGLSENLSDLVAEGRQDLREIPGIGEGIAKKVTELVTTGECQEHQKLLSEIPGSLLELLRIPGVGPKKINLFYQKLNIQTMDDLERAVREHKIRAMRGLGEKTEEKIRKGIESFKKSKGRVLLSEAVPIAEALVTYLSELPQVQKIQTAGSYRRCKETVGDLDILITCKESSPVMDRFVRFGRVREVIAKGATKSSVLLTNGLQVDVRVLEEESFGAALQYFTGSKAHNIAIRDIARRKGLKISEYGVFKVTNGKEKRVAGETEEEVYRAIGLPWIPAELRENMGEIEAASKGKLPELIRDEDILGDLHMHTVESDGKNTILEMAEAAKQRGLKYIAITDHSKSTFVARGLDEKRLLNHIKEIDKANGTMKGIRILKGCECDIKPDGSLDFDDEILAQLDVVVVSVHSKMGMPRDEMTERVIKAFSNPYAHIFGHPSGRILKRRDPYQIDMEKIMKAALKYKVALELDSYPDRLDLNDIYCKMAKEKGVKVVIDTDSHRTEHFPNLRYGIYMARRGWLEKTDVLNTLPVDKFLKRLRNW